MLQNVPKPKITYGGDLCVISVVEAAKKSLLLGFDIALIRAKHYNEDVEKHVNNSEADSRKCEKN